MTETGLVSVTFRALDYDNIIDLTVRAGLGGIEWGGDIHVPHGDVTCAAAVAAATRQRGLSVLSYGSYYRCDGGDFDAVLRTAVALDAPVIRVWAGGKDGGDASPDERDAIVADLRRVCDMAYACGVCIATEYHRNTLTDTQQSVVRLFDEVGRDNFYTYWQPLDNTTHEQNLRNIAQLCDLHKLWHIHAYHWVGRERLPLRGGADAWRAYVAAAYNAQAVLLEFVKDDAPSQFLDDATCLKESMI